MKMKSEKERARDGTDFSEAAADTDYFSANYLLFDMKVLCKNYYTLLLKNNGTAAEIHFSNGQRFEVSIKELPQ